MVKIQYCRPPQLCHNSSIELQGLQVQGHANIAIATSQRYRSITTYFFDIPLLRPGARVPVCRTACAPAVPAGFPQGLAESPSIPFFCVRFLLHLAASFTGPFRAATPDPLTLEASATAFTANSCCRRLPLTGRADDVVLSFLRLSIELDLNSALQG